MIARGTVCQRKLVGSFPSSCSPWAPTLWSSLLLMPFSQLMLLRRLNVWLTSSLASSRGLSLDSCLFSSPENGEKTRGRSRNWEQSHKQADSHFKTEINNYLNQTQMLHIFGSILLPSCAPSNWARKNTIIIILIIPGIQISLVSVNHKKRNYFTLKSSVCFKCFKVNDRIDVIEARTD